MEAGPSQRKKTMMKETTKSVAESKALPVEVLVKIFNFLPNHDIRCGVSLACKEFYKICHDESLVPVKDLCIYGQPVHMGPIKYTDEGKNYYSLSPYLSRVVSDIICQSKNLTFLKIKASNANAINELVSIALQACPKLTHLEIIETKQLCEYFECKIKYGCNL